MSTFPPDAVSDAGSDDEAAGTRPVPAGAVDPTVRLEDAGVVIGEPAPLVVVDREAVVGQFMQTSRLMVAIAARTVAEVDSQVSMPQFRLLVVLYLGGTQRVSDLAAELGVHPSTAGRMVERLVAKRFIAREEGSDRRETLVRLTPRGREFADETTRRRREQFRDLLNLFDDAELAQIGRGLALVNAAHDEIGLTYAGEADDFVPW